MELVCNAQFCHTPYGTVHKVAVSSHYKPHIVAPLEHLVGSLYKILRPLLEGDTSKEGNNLLLNAPLRLHVLELIKVHSIVQSNNLCRVYLVFVDHNVSGKVAHRNNLICSKHTHALNGIDLRIHILACSVILCGVHVYYKRFSRYALCSNTCRIGKPVVRVNHIKLILCRNGGCNHSIL